MKKTIYSLIAFLFLHIHAFCQMPKPVEAEIKTPDATCAACKSIIETAVKQQVDGLIKINVIYKRGVTLVKWYPDRTNIEELKTAIANAGFDAGDVTANVDYYNRLPVCCKKEKNEPVATYKRIIPRQKAINIAANDAGDFKGMWVEAVLKNYWRITLHFKSTRAPMHYVIDAKDGRILLKIDDTDDPDQQKKLEEFLSANEPKDSIP